MGIRRPLNEASTPDKQYSFNKSIIKNQSGDEKKQKLLISNITKNNKDSKEFRESKEQSDNKNSIEGKISINHKKNLSNCKNSNNKKNFKLSKNDKNSYEKEGPSKKSFNLSNIEYINLKNKASSSHHSNNISLSQFDDMKYFNNSYIIPKSIRKIANKPSWIKQKTLTNEKAKFNVHSLNLSTKAYKKKVDFFL